MSEEEKKYYESERVRLLRVRLRSLGTVVKNMRKAQREYYATSSNHKELKKMALKTAVQHEGQTDQFIKLLETEKLI